MLMTTDGCMHAEVFGAVCANGFDGVFTKGLHVAMQSFVNNGDMLADSLATATNMTVAAMVMSTTLYRTKLLGHEALLV